MIITTGLYAAVLTLIVLAMAGRIVALRRKHGVGYGPGEQRELGLAIRVHGNAIENLPLALIMMGALELSNVGSLWLHLIGMALVLGRILHATGLSKRPGTSFGRFYGTLITWTTIAIMAIWLIVVFVRSAI